MTNSWVRIVAAMVCVMLATACSAEIEPDGPLWLGDVYSGENRHDDPPGGTTGLEAEHFEGTVTVNGGIVQNKDDAPVRVTDISLIAAKHMKLVDVAFIPGPVKTKDGFRFYWPGTGDPYPPPDDTKYDRSWDEHIDAVGATLKPNDVWVLVVAVRIENSRASYQRVRVRYVDSHGQKYERLNSISIVVAPAAELQEATENAH